MNSPRIDTIYQTIEVKYRFPVSFTSGLFEIENPVFRDTLVGRDNNKTHRLVCIVDDGVAETCTSLIRNIQTYIDTNRKNLSLARSPIVVPGGETIKNDQELREHLHQVIVDAKLDRHSYVVGIGGGALLDAVGFVAATAHRGIRHIRVPTTVLAQGDSAASVKNGVNRYGKKNYLGTFSPPHAVINDYNFIAALPDRDKVSGMAEAIKVALVKDRFFFDWLEKHHAKLARFDADAMQYMIRRCTELHMSEIMRHGDPFENGHARPLAFGHWAAHRLETLTNFTLKHGEAVAIGMAIDARYSVLSNHLAPGGDERLCRLLENLGFSLWNDALLDNNSSGERGILQGINDFNEQIGGELSITLLADIGEGLAVDSIDVDRVLSAIDWLSSRLNNIAA